MRFPQARRGSRNARRGQAQMAMRIPRAARRDVQAARRIPRAAFGLPRARKSIPRATRRHPRIKECFLRGKNSLVPGAARASQSGHSRPRGINADPWLAPRASFSAASRLVVPGYTALMLRRVAWWLRLFLLLLGTAAIVAVPLSVVSQTWVNLYVPQGEFLLNMQDACIRVGVSPPHTSFSFEPRLVKVHLRRWSSMDDVLARGRLPTLRRAGNEIHFTVPLWLLATVCLAWPVTSFIVARRRHKRGFPIAAKTDGAVSPSDR